MTTVVFIMWLMTPASPEWFVVGSFGSKGKCWEVAFRYLRTHQYGPSAALQCLETGDKP